MALTYRQTKGSALTIQELDANFQFFTGSFSQTGSSVVSGSLTVIGPLIVSGNLLPGNSQNTLGSSTNPWKSVFLSPDSLNFVSGSTSSSFSLTSSGSLSGSYTGSFGGSGTGSFSGSYTGYFSFTSGSCLIACTSSIVPTFTGSEGLFQFVYTGSQRFLYVYLGGRWSSSSLA
jgi:hypothetical protein